MRYASLLLTFLVGLTLTGCTRDKAAAPAPAAKAAAEAAAEAKVHGVGAALQGTVLQTMDSGGYTYMLLETSAGKKWVAVGESAVKVGQEVGVTSPTLMKAFKSKTLDRTFDEIYFGSLAGSGESHAAGAGQASVPAGHPPLGGGEQKSGARAQPVMDIGDAPKKAEGADGRSVAEVFEQAAQLADKAVAVRGKVVKINKGIMGRNWLHLQDGSGAVADGSHDLTVTTQAEAKQGDVVLVRGVVRVNKDFGAGYKYAVIVEDGKLSN